MQLPQAGDGGVGRGPVDALGAGIVCMFRQQKRCRLWLLWACHVDMSGLLVA